MEQKIIQQKIYEDNKVIIFQVPTTLELTVYEKREDDFHNKFATRVSTLKNVIYDDVLKNLLYKLLTEGQENGK